jgi:hypothetical protein
MITEDEFQWFGEGADGIVIVPDQLAVAVYENVRGEIVIRQKGDMYEDQDAIVILHKIPARVIAQAIFETAGLGAMPERNERDGEASPGDGSVTPAALRQRRYRERHRHSQSEAEQPGLLG